MSKWYEHGLSNVEDDHTGLILFLVGSQIECFIGEEEACHIEILKKYLRYQWSYCIVASQRLYWYEKMIWKYIIQCWRWSCTAKYGLSSIYNRGFYWWGGSMSYWNSQKVTQIWMELMCCRLTMVIMIWENDMKMNCQVLKMIIQD